MRISLRARPAAVTMAVALVACAAVSSINVETSAAATLPPAPVATEHRIPGGDTGVELYLDQKKLATLSPVPEGKVVLFLEPFGVPTAKAFDVPGLSWMDSLSQAGYDTWALDVRGFGKSTRAPAMDNPNLMANPPMTSTAEAVRDVDAAVRYITEQRGVDKVSVVGWSWGGLVAGAYAAENPSLVDNLVLYGAMNSFSMPADMMAYMGLESAPGVLKTLPAYQFAAFDPTTLMHWNMMMAGRPLATPESIDAVRKVFMASDPTSGNRTPPTIRRAMGPMVDLYSTWTNKAVFDASKITAPVLVIRGDADFFADPNLIGSLTGASYTREVVVPDATHWLLYEQHRDVLLSETQALLGRTTTSTPPVTAPGAPTGVTAVPGNGQAVVSWTPSTSGGAATSYKVTASPGGITVTTTGTTATLAGLTNGTSYTFTVTAVNSAGTAVSAASAAVTPSAASAAVDPPPAAVVPAGAPATGAGGTAGSGYSPLLGIGGLALFLGGAAMVPAIRRRRQACPTG